MTCKLRGLDMIKSNVVSNYTIKDDKKLIEFFKTDYKKREFIDASRSYKSFATVRESTGELIEQLDDTSHLHQGENIDIVLKLWKNLLGDAIVFLKSSDNRERFHDGEIFGVDNIYVLLKAFKKFETILYGASEYYRDHLAHVFRVFLLGDFLIQKSFDYSKLNVGSPDFIKEISPQEKECMWCIISLTHDLGYALEKIDTINKQVGDMVKEYGRVTIQELSYLFPSQWQIIDDFMLKFISSNLQKIDAPNGPKYITHIQSKYFLKFARAYERYDHGLIGSSVLMRWLVYFLESDFMMDSHKFLDKDDARQFLIRQNILRAIASHSCDDIYHLNITNFPCLLVLFDEMQEWGRPRLSDVFKRAIPTASLVINSFNESKVDYVIKFDCERPSSFEEKELKNNVLKYFIRKSERFIKIFRSAVGGHPEKDPRSIDLTFEVKDGIGTQSSYKLMLPQPKDTDERLSPEILKNDVKTTLQNLR